MVVHELFENSVASSPDRIAISYQEHQITYGVLNQKANQLSHYLIKQGVSLETPVAICTARSPDLIIGLLAILKAGGTYVPLDPDYPEERLQYMLDDSRAPIIITTSSVANNLPNNWAMSIVLDEIIMDLSFESRNDPNTNIPADSLCYIIYTSGSIGKPKGVGVKHEGVINLIQEQRNRFKYSQQSKGLQFASMSFDAAVSEWGCALTEGVGLNLINKEDINSENYVSKYLINQATLPISIINTNSSIIDGYKGILVLAGEKIDKKNLLFIKNNNHVQIINAYGPTEATVCVSCTETNKQLETIGRPIHNTQIHILDKYLNELPIGSVGEIYIGGVGLARGYINNPSLTSEKFIANPFGDGSRLYCTGDLAKYLPDGNIEFMGRADHQVKIRGFRIELGEIESILQKSIDIQQAVVLAREDIPGQKRLVGYVTLTQESKGLHASQSSYEEELIKSLRELTNSSLPDYMQPSQILVLDSFPLTSNGKLDRKSLPAPEGREGIEGYQPPEGLLEQQLALIWSELLNIEKVGRNDNFFNLGGHSLVATQLISRIRQEQNIEVPLAAVFEHPTLKELAKSVENEYLNQSVLPPIEKTPRDEPIPLSLAQQRLWFIEQLLPNSTLYHIPVNLRLVGKLNTRALTQSLNKLSQRHEILRTLITTKDGIGSQVILSKNTPFNLTELDCTNKSDEEIEKYIIEEANSPFDFDTQPLCRAKLLRVNKREHILLITFHHIISDGWSYGVWNKELSHLYTSYSNNKDPILSELSIQYADFSVWQRNWLSGQTLENQLSYWQNKLADIPEEIHLPTNRARPKTPSYSGSSVFDSLGLSLTNQLESFALQANTTPFVVALSAFSILLHRYSQQDDVIIGTPVANRSMQETEALIGFFVNTLALRVNFSGTPSFQDICSQVNQTILDGYAHQNIPFEQLVDHLNIERSLSRNPIFQVEFGLDDISNEQELKLNNLKVSYCSVGKEKAKFDLRAGIKKDKDQYFMYINYAVDLFNKATVL